MIFADQTSERRLRSLVSDCLGEPRLVADLETVELAMRNAGAMEVDLAAIG